MDRFWTDFGPILGSILDRFLTRIDGHLKVFLLGLVGLFVGLVGLDCAVER